MHNKKPHFIKENESPQASIEGFYKSLFSSSSDEYTKLMALDYLANFTENIDVRMHLTSLMHKEKSSQILEVYEKILSGRYTSSLKRYFDDYKQWRYEFSKEEQTQSEELMEKEHQQFTTDFSKLVPFYKYKN